VVTLTAFLQPFQSTGIAQLNKNIGKIFNQITSVSIKFNFLAVPAGISYVFNACGKKFAVAANDFVSFHVI